MFSPGKVNGSDTESYRARSVHIEVDDDLDRPLYGRFTYHEDTKPGSPVVTVMPGWGPGGGGLQWVGERITQQSGLPALAVREYRRSGIDVADRWVEERLPEMLPGKDVLGMKERVCEKVYDRALKEGVVKKIAGDGPSTFMDDTRAALERSGELCEEEGLDVSDTRIPVGMSLGGRAAATVDDRNVGPRIVVVPYDQPVYDGKPLGDPKRGTLYVVASNDNVATPEDNGYPLHRRTPAPSMLVEFQGDHHTLQSPTNGWNGDTSGEEGERLLKAVEDLSYRWMDRRLNGGGMPEADGPWTRVETKPG